MSELWVHKCTAYVVIKAGVLMQNNWLFQGNISIIAFWAACAKTKTLDPTVLGLQENKLPTSKFRYIKFLT